MLLIAPGQEAQRDIFLIFFNMKVYCVLSKHNILVSLQTLKITLNYPKSATMEFFQGTQE